MYHSSPIQPRSLATVTPIRGAADDPRTVTTAPSRALVYEVAGCPHTIRAVNDHASVQEPLSALLTESEQEMWQSLLTVVLSLPVVLDRGLQSADGLSHFDYSILARLSQAPDSQLRLNDLAHQTGSTLPRLSKAITRCEREGWAIRRPDPAGGRSTLAILTDAGRERLLVSMPAHIAQVRRLIFDPLTTEEQPQLAGALSRIAEAVQRDLY